MQPPAAATYFGSNSWLLEIAGLRVLVDPWLVDALVFPPGPWLLKGELPQPWPIPEHLDLLLLTQGLADHAHPATLARLPKDLPVVGSAAAAKVVKGLGFSQVTSLSPGQHHNREISTSRPPLVPACLSLRMATCWSGPKARCIWNPTVCSTLPCRSVPSTP